VFFDLLAGRDTVGAPASPVTAVLELPAVALVLGCLLESVVVSLQLRDELFLSLVQTLQLLDLSFEQLILLEAFFTYEWLFWTCFLLLLQRLYHLILLV